MKIKWLLSLQEWHKRSDALSSSACEVALGMRQFSRLGKLELSEGHSLATQMSKSSQKAILLWDLLMTQARMEAAQKSLQNLDLNLFSALRLQDPGAFLWAKEHCPHKDLHLILEHGNHNLEALKGWIELGGKQLKRVILSPQIPLPKLKDFIELARSHEVETELMLLGPLLLFYSPRSLLKPLYSHLHQRGELKVKADSEESPHKNFDVVENDRGTFMFHPKDLCLAESLFQLQKMGLSAVRLDLWEERPLSLLPKLQEALNVQQIQSILKKHYPRKYIHGFSRANKSHVLFKKLKNQRIAERNEHYLGDVVDIKKKSYLAISLTNPDKKLSLNDTLEYRTPEGKVFTSTVTELKNSAGKKCQSLMGHQIAILKPMSSISPKTAVYWLASKK